MGVKAVREEDCGLRVLRIPPGKAKIDIVAVHGMGAHPDDTWSAMRAGVEDRSDPNSYINWLEDSSMLAAAMPAARIMRYGYQSRWFGAGSVHTRMSYVADKFLEALHGEREALVKAGNDLEYGMEYISSRIAGLVFFGTPFHGAHESLSQGRILELAEAHIAAAANMDNVRGMQAGDEMLESVVDDYLTQQDDIFPVTVCFYEQNESDVSALIGPEHRGKQRVLLVDRRSGTLHRSSTVSPYARACDHFALNKFRGPELEDWKYLARKLLQMQEEYVDDDEVWGEEDDGVKGKVKSFGRSIKKMFWKRRASTDDEDDEDDEDDDDDGDENGNDHTAH